MPAEAARATWKRALTALLPLTVLVLAVGTWKGAEINVLLADGGWIPLGILAHTRVDVTSTKSPIVTSNFVEEVKERDPDPFAESPSEAQGEDYVVDGNLSQAEQASSEDFVDEEMENFTTGALLTEQTASKRVAQLQRFLGALKGPIIVGGIGDSGTRGTVDLLESLHVAMGDWRVRNSARDSRLFMRHYPVVYGKHIKYAGPTAYYAKGISSAHSLLYGKDTLEKSLGKRGLTHWFSGIQWVVETVMAHVKHYRLFSAAYKDLAKQNRIDRYVWGFKHPRALTLLPYFKGALGTGMKVVHVIRDGRDIALGDNRMMMRSLCKRYFGEEFAAKGYCRAGGENQNDLRFWAVLNMDISKWARANLPKDQYLIVRTEDLVNGKLECFERVQRFLYDDGDERMLSQSSLKKLADRYARYNSSYNGNKHASYIRRKITAQMRQVPEASEAMDYFGYNRKQQMGTSKSCVELDHR